MTATEARAGACWELRLYDMLPRRLPDMHHQFAWEIPPLFERAGVPPPLAFWDCFAGPATGLLAYMLRWNSLDERMAAWGRFYADPQWWKQYEDAHGGGQMLEQSHVLVLRASPAWQPAPSGSDLPRGIHELRMIELLPGHADAAHDALAQVDLPALQRAGAGVLGLFDVVVGDRLPRAAMMLAWPDIATRDSAWDLHASDESVRSARAHEQRAHGAALAGAAEAWLLRPADYGPRCGALV